jgi:hypothetical protein
MQGCLAACGPIDAVTQSQSSRFAPCCTAEVADSALTCCFDLTVRECGRTSCSRATGSQSSSMAASGIAALNTGIRRKATPGIGVRNSPATSSAMSGITLPWTKPGGESSESGSTSRCWKRSPRSRLLWHGDEMQRPEPDYIAALRRWFRVISPELSEAHETRGRPGKCNERFSILQRPDHLGQILIPRI